MFRPFVAVAAALLCCAAVCAQEVIVLTEENFDDYTNDGDLWLVEFYAPWCGHCKHLAPIFDKAAEELAGKVRLGKVDATAQTGLRDRFDVDGFPTLKFSTDGDNWRDYTHGRTLSDFLQFGERMTSPPVTFIGTEEELDAVLKVNPVTFALCGASESSNVATLYATAAASMQDSQTFVSVTSDEVCSSLAGSQQPALVKLQRKEDPIVAGESSLSNVDTITEWVLDNQFRVVSPLNRDTYRGLTQSKKKLVVAAVTRTAEAAELEKELTIAARRYAKLGSEHPLASKFLFATIDAVAWDKFVEQFVESKDLPTVFVLQPSDKKYFVDTSVTTADEMETFLHGIVDGSIQPLSQESTAEVVLGYMKSPLGLAALLAVMGVIAFLCMMGDPVDPPKRE